MKAFQEIGWQKALSYVWLTLVLLIYRLTLLSPIRVAFLRLLGARIGRNVVVHDLHFFNSYRKGFRAVQVGDNVFIGDETLFDLADDIILENEVTLAERVTVLTHTNVGYRDHPLQKYFPAFTRPVHFGQACFIGVNATIMPGVVVGAGAFVAAGAVVTHSIPPGMVVAGVPARVIPKVTDAVDNQQI